MGAWRPHPPATPTVLSFAESPLYAQRCANTLPAPGLSAQHRGSVPQTGGRPWASVNIDFPPHHVQLVPE